MPALSPAALRTVRQIRLARQLGAATRPRKNVPAQQPPDAIARDYAAELIALVERTQVALAPLLAELPALLEVNARARRDGEEPRYDAASPTCHWCRGKGRVDARDAVRIDDRPQDVCACRSLWRLDAGEGKRVHDLINQAQQSLARGLAQPQLDDQARRFAESTETYQRLQFLKQTKAALGIDIRLADPRLPAIIDGFAAENVALIKDIPARIMRDVELATTRAMTSGQLWPQLAKDLEARFGYSRKRAKLIARDQVGKLYGQVNAERQQEVGIQRFKWRTVHDPRVRSEHVELDDKVFSYDKPLRDGLPGEPVNCRCWADPQFDEILAAIDADDDDEAAPPIIPPEPPSLLPAFQARVQPITAARGRPRASGEDLQAAVNALVAKTGTFTGTDVGALAQQLGHSTHKIHEMLVNAAAEASTRIVMAHQAVAQAAAEEAVRAAARASLERAVKEHASRWSDLNDADIKRIAREHGITPAKFRRALIQQVQDDAKAKIVELPAPPPSAFTKAQRDTYRKSAIASIASSRRNWEHHLASHTSGLSPASALRRPGMTYSAKEFRDLRAAAVAKLTPEAVDAGLFYSHQGDRMLNSALREDRFDKEHRDVKRLARRLDKAIASYKMPEDVYVARGVSGQFAQQFVSLLKPGDVFREKGYTSTAATEPFSGDVAVRIKVPKGSKAGPIASNYATEDEFLLPRGSMFQVVSIARDPNSSRMLVDLLLIPN
jgi:SPP1 gp7 family putative phage head morphogenesis protein